MKNASHATLIVAFAALAACGAKSTPITCPVRDFQVPELVALGQKNQNDVQRVLTQPGNPSAWFGVDLPVDGRFSLLVRITDVRPESASHAHDQSRPFDVAVVLYDRDFQAIARVDEAPGGIRKRKQTWPSLAKGRYYIHAYLQKGLTLADVEIEFALEPAPVAQLTDESGAQPVGPSEPGNTAAPPLQADKTGVSTNADAGGPTTAPVPPATAPTPPAAAPTPVPQEVVAKISEIRHDTGTGGSIITINRGRNDGIGPQWAGQVLGRSQQPVGPVFKLIKVGKRECIAKVPLTRDQLTSHRDQRNQVKVRLTPPAP